MAATIPGSSSTTVDSSSKSTSTPCDGDVVVMDLAGLVPFVLSSAKVGVLEPLHVWIEVDRVGTPWIFLAVLPQFGV